jgi:hypothetical protein
MHSVLFYSDDLERKLKEFVVSNYNWTLTSFFIVGIRAAPSHMLSPLYYWHNQALSEYFASWGWF